MPHSSAHAPSPARIRVLMACWNESPEHLSESVDSLRAQTLQDWELALVDDGSTDPATLEALDRLREDPDPRIMVLRQDNAGPAAARNTAARGAEAPFFFVLDADDLLTPEALRLSVEALEADESHRIATGHGTDFGEWTTEPAIQVYDPEQVFSGGVLAVQSACRRADFEEAGGFAEAMRDGLEDYEFWLRMLNRVVLPRGGKVVYLDETLYRYRVKPTSRTTSVTGDLDKLYRAKGQVVAGNPEYFSAHPDKVYFMEKEYREQLARWQARYGRVERLIDLLRLRRFVDRV